MVDLPVTDIELEGMDENLVQALMMAEVVKRVLLKRAEIRLYQKPAIQKKEIVEFRQRMRVSGVTKFQDKTYIATVNFYKNAKDLMSQFPVGALVLYVPETYVDILMKKLQYPVFDLDDEEQLKDACGTFCNLIAGNFNTGLISLGYSQLEMSHFSTYENDILNGVEIPADQKYFYEISFTIDGEVKIVIDYIMGPIPRS